MSEVPTNPSSGRFVPVALDKGAELARRKGWQYVNLDAESFEIASDVLALMEARVAREHNVVPVELRGGREVLVACSNPNDFEMRQKLSPLFAGLTVRLVYANADAIRRRIEVVYSAKDEAARLAGQRQKRRREAHAGGDIGRIEGLGEGDNVKVLRLVIEQALRDKASDIHIEPTEVALEIRYRVDGKLRLVASYPLARAEGLVTLIKVDAQMKTDNSLVPDSGVMVFKQANAKDVDIRVETTPTAWGQSAVMRLQSDIWRALDTLGFSERNEKRFRDAIEQPVGLILATGPTGSGKALSLSTTVPTPSGNTTMGALKVGDEVLGRDGQPCRVTGLSPIDETPDLYRVKFSDGQEIIADGDHQWLVSDHPNGSLPRTKKRVQAIKRHQAAHEAAADIETLAGRWRGRDLMTSTELHALLKRFGLDDEYPSPYTVASALDVTGCPRQDGQRQFDGTVGVVEYPTDVALKSLALRLQQRFSDAPSTLASLHRLTTNEMLARGLRLNQGHANFAVPVTEALDLPEVGLPVDPYLFGTWLGDGPSGTGQIAFDHKPLDGAEHPDQHYMIEQIKAAGYECHTLDSAPHTVSVPGLQAALRETGALGNKHIPATYARASRDQRLAVLQGLMDTDGTVDVNGNCELSLSDKRLATDALDLIRGLGIKASISWDQPEGSGVRPRHRIHFATDQPVFRLPRKAEHLPAEVRETQKWLYITDIEPVLPGDADYGPARCISVDSPDHTYLCGDGYGVTSNSTTLYSALREKIHPEVKIATLENPIEYKAPSGISQIAINDAQGMTFAGGLRSILRQDPDIILVGEIRDAETAETAIDAAMTGHLVFSTLHTNDAPGAIPRLTRMNIEPLLVADSLVCVLAQRLVRRLCSTCRITQASDIDSAVEWGFDADLLPDQMFAPHPSGCNDCHGTGWSGRVPIHEVMLMNDDMADAISSDAPHSVLYRLAIAAGMTPMREDGFWKALEGQTTLAEVNASTRRALA